MKLFFSVPKRTAPSFFKGPFRFQISILNYSFLFPLHISGSKIRPSDDNKKGKTTRALDLSRYKRILTAFTRILDLFLSVSQTVYRIPLYSNDSSIWFDTMNLASKIQRNDWLLANTCPQAANHCALF